MNLLIPNLVSANGAKVVVSSLFDSLEPGFLTQDLLLVELPGKTYIDVSWFPEHDPGGAYTVTIFRGHEQIADVETKSARGAIEIVESWARRLTQGTATVAGHTEQIKNRVSPCGAFEATIASCSTVGSITVPDAA